MKNNEKENNSNYIENKYSNNKINSIETKQTKSDENKKDNLFDNLEKVKEPNNNTISNIKKETEEQELRNDLDDNISFNDYKLKLRENLMISNSNPISDQIKKEDNIITIDNNRKEENNKINFIDNNFKDFNQPQNSTINNEINNIGINNNEMNKKVKIEKNENKKKEIKLK